MAVVSETDTIAGDASTGKAFDAKTSRVKFKATDFEGEPLSLTFTRSMKLAFAKRLKEPAIKTTPEEALMLNGPELTTVKVNTLLGGRKSASVALICKT